MLLLTTSVGLYSLFTPILKVRCKLPGINIRDCNRRHAAGALRILVPFTMDTYFYFTYIMRYCLYKFIFSKITGLDWRGDWAEATAIIISIVLYWLLLSVLIKTKEKITPCRKGVILLCYS